MRQPYISFHDGRERPVKNLGWLLRNWRDVEEILISHTPRMFQLRPEPGAELVVYLNNGRRYTAEFADFGIALHFVHRPVFEGLPLIVDGKRTTISRPPTKAVQDMVHPSLRWWRQ